MMGEYGVQPWVSEAVLGIPSTSRGHSAKVGESDHPNPSKAAWKNIMPTTWRRLSQLSHYLEVNNCFAILIVATLVIKQCVATEQDLLLSKVYW